jgi:hypothetical protein
MSTPNIVMETRTRSGGKRSMVVVEGGDERYFKTKEEIDVFLRIFPHNQEIDKNVLREIMVRAIRPASGHRRNIRYTNTLKVIDKRSGTLESGDIVIRLGDWKFDPKDYPKGSMKLRLKQHEMLCIDDKNNALYKGNVELSMRDIQQKVVKDKDPIIMCCARNVRENILDVTVETMKPSTLLHCGALIPVAEENDIITCGRYITDFHVDAAGTLRMHLLLSGRKLIIIATSLVEKYADYYNSFKSTQVDYTTKLRWVLEKPDMWDVVIQDQRFVVPIITFILMQCTDNTYLF